MKEMAKDADLIINTRLETAPIGQSAGRDRRVGSIEAIAYGTAIKYQK